MKSLDNSNGVQYYGGNDPAKMGGRIKKGQVAGGGSKSKLNSFESKLRSGTVSFDRVMDSTKSGNKRLNNKPQGGKTFEGGVKGAGIKESVRREKRAMTSGDISRNAGIQSARLERQGQTRLF